MKQYHVIVIGAGLAGLQTARLLAHRGVKVLLVDRKPRLVDSIHTTGIFVRRTLEDFHIPEDCLGPPVRHVSLYSPARRQLELVSQHDEFRIGRMGRLYERMLEHCLLHDVEWMPGTRYAGHCRVGGKLVVRLDRKMASRWVSVRYLVGADGATSRLAKRLQLDTNREWIVGVEDVWSDVPLDGPPRLHCFIDPKLAPGYLAWIAHDGEEAHIGVGGYPRDFDPLGALQLFRTSVRDIIDLSRARHIERRGGRIPVGGVLRRIANSEGLLVGDAAGAVSPLTAGGLDPCMRLSTLAAQVIIDHLNTDDTEALEAYTGNSFRTRFMSRLWMRRLMSHMHSRALTEIACASLKLPGLNSIASHVFFGRGSFPDVNIKLAPQPAMEVQ